MCSGPFPWMRVQILAPSKGPLISEKATHSHTRMTLKISAENSQKRFAPFVKRENWSTTICFFSFPDKQKQSETEKSFIPTEPSCRNVSRNNMAQVADGNVRINREQVTKRFFPNVYLDKRETLTNLLPVLDGSTTYSGAALAPRIRTTQRRLTTVPLIAVLSVV